MTGRHFRFLGACTAFSLLATSAAAQGRLPITWTIDADNDFFNFWQAIADRPDDEYTQGAELSATWSARALVLPGILRAPSPCMLDQPLDEPCGRLRLAIGQQMYTPDVDSPALLPGQRPYAGWLYVRLSESSESPRGLDELSMTIGVTGPPSLAEAAQDVWHKWFNFRTPLGWAGQLPFEPDFDVSFARAREVISPGSFMAHALHVAPYGRATIGTLATDVTVGGSVTAGINPRPAWQPTARRMHDRRLGLYITGDVQSKLVLRNLFLDGTTFRPSNSVSKEPLVGQISGGIGLSAGRFRFEWTAVHLSREYSTQLMGHTYSELTLRVE